MSQVQKLGYGRYIMVHVWWGKGIRLGTLADVQACQHDSTAHVQYNSDTSVPLKEWNYNQTGKCSLFVQLSMLEVILSTLSWYALVSGKSAR